MKKIQNFLDKHVIIFSSALFIVSTPVLWFILDFPLKALGVNYQYSLAIKNILSAVFCIVAMRCISGKVFSFKGRHFFKSLFTFGIVGVIGSIGAFVFNISEIDLHPTTFSIIGYILMNFAIAFHEEVLFRGIILNTMLNVWAGQRNVVMKAVFISSALFGLKHFINLFAHPDQIVTTSAQVVFAGMAGIYLAAVYIRSRNIWVVIAIHFLQDMAVTIWELFSTQAIESAIGDISLLQALLMIVIQIPYLWVGLLMLREKKVSSDKI